MDWGVPVVAPYLPIPIIHSPPPLVELKTNKVMAEKTYPVTSSEMSRIYNVACADWKQKIQDIMVEHGMLFNSVGNLRETIVQRMFAAATEE